MTSPVSLEALLRRTAVEASARDAAIVASLALQYGVPLVTLQQALTRNGDGSPSSPLGRLGRSVGEQCGGPAVMRADLRLEVLDQRIGDRIGTFDAPYPMCGLNFIKCDPVASLAPLRGFGPLRSCGRVQ
jgi:hypothetical protein